MVTASPWGFNRRPPGEADFIANGPKEPSARNFELPRVNSGEPELNGPRPGGGSLNSPTTPGRTYPESTPLALCANAIAPRTPARSPRPGSTMYESMRCKISAACT